MEKLNLVEILKDCPKGTKLYSPALGECALEKVIDNSDYPIKVTYKIINNDTRFDYFTKYGYLLINKPDAECMLFPSKEQRDWNKWQRPFVKGDILVTEAGNIVLCSHIDEKQLVHYHCILNFLGTLKICNDIGVGYSYNCNLANDSQKQKLFDALKKEGYEWDAEKKELKTLQPFKDGDVVTCENQIAIFKKYISDYSGLAECYVFLDNNLEMDIDGHYYVTDLATEKEKAKLFKALEDNGYRWNPETKILEQLIVPKFKVGDKVVKKGCSIPVLISEINDGNYYSITENSIGSFKIKEQDNWELVPNKFDITTLKPFDKVLVRDNNTSIWVNAFFGFYDIVITKNYPFLASGINWTQCIPYEGNEHLLGTYEDCDEYYKNW